VSEAISVSSFCALALGQWRIVGAFSFLGACPEMKAKGKGHGYISVSFRLTDPLPRFYCKNTYGGFYDWETNKVLSWRTEKERKRGRTER
jgi:hypothetical protein